MSKGRALELFFVEGDPEGMATAEVMNWTGHVLRVPRNALKLAFQREEANRTGCYLLRGAVGDGIHVYVGESEAIGKRISQHDLSKDWWDEAYFITTTSNLLHKAHIKYLEARLVEMVKSAGKVAVENGNIPTKSRLSEAATSSMEEFLDILRIALGALGLDDLSSGARENNANVQVSGDVAKNLDEMKFYLSTPKNGVEGCAFLDGSDFIVVAGSVARQAWSSKMTSHSSYRKIHERLLNSGTLKIVNDLAVFQEDYALKSPSAAAAVMNGRASNGRIEWKTKDGTTFHDWEVKTLRD
ncbi:MAG: GIY-YIG nuclease family protein [Pseudomonadota bacterium]